MKTKKILWCLLALMIVTISGVGISACGDDDDDKKSGIEGTWEGTSGRHTLKLIFQSGSIGRWIDTKNDSYSGSQSESGSFTYTMAGPSRGTIAVKFKDSYSYSGAGIEIYYFEVLDTTMYVYEDGYGEDLEWILTKR